METATCIHHVGMRSGHAGALDLLGSASRRRLGQGGRRDTTGELRCPAANTPLHLVPTIGPQTSSEQCLSMHEQARVHSAQKEKAAQL